MMWGWLEMDWHLPVFQINLRAKQAVQVACV
jgi:hypothetical protein